jgi:hypothetical protein
MFARHVSVPLLASFILALLTKKRQSCAKQTPSIIQSTTGTTKETIMKLHLLSLFPFFAIANSVSGYFLRADADRRALDLIYADKDEITENENEFTPLGKIRKKNVLDPKNENEFTTLGRLRKKEVDSRTQEQKDYEYKHCVQGVQAGNGFVTKNTTKIYGQVTPIVGCVAMKAEKLEGGIWTTSGEVARPCVAEPGRVLRWEDDATYRVNVFEADGDSFLMTVCWD